MLWPALHRVGRLTSDIVTGMSATQFTRVGRIARITLGSCCKEKIIHYGCVYVFFRSIVRFSITFDGREKTHKNFRGKCGIISELVWTKPLLP